MRNSNRLHTNQQNFLRLIRDEPITLTQACEKLNIAPHILSRWLRRKSFCETLDDIIKEGKVRRDLEIELAANYAAHRLNNMCRGIKDKGERDTNLIRLACTNVLAIANRVSRKAPKKPVENLPEVSPFHPSVSEAEAEQLLAQLNPNS